jgi:uroporphyrinogen III methyltransferase/synthase
MKRGKVYLVGAGPGDPGLLTLKGLECLKEADVILYDRLLDDRLLTFARPDAKKLAVGKSAHRHSTEQEEINRRLVKEAQQGKTVIRLKGGDPFIFGRGGEEAEVLAQNHIPYEVVPGVSSVAAVPAYAGIPLTHRDLASSFAVVTGHESSTKPIPVVAWDKIATGADTLVCLMGMENLSNIVGRLIASGLPMSTPVAVIANGTTNRQETITGTLSDIVLRAQQRALPTPALIVVGEVVRLRERLRWFDLSPLLGKRVLVTRPGEQASHLSELLFRHGAIPVQTPAIEIEPLPSYDELDQAKQMLLSGAIDVVAFTSSSQVAHLVSVLGTERELLNEVVIACIGPRTREAAVKRGLRVDIVAQKQTVAGLVEALDAYYRRRSNG